MNTYITGGIIKKLREEKGMTQSGLAEKLGVSDKTVSKWETGKGYPDITLIEPISDTLGVSVSELLSGNKIVNENYGFNMNRTCFYVCPVCGNVFYSSGKAVISCHGITLLPLESDADEKHIISYEPSEDEYYVSVNHEMSKTHYISFIAAVTDNSVSLVKLYPEGNAEARFKKNKTYMLYAYCNRHGLFKVKVQNNMNKYKAEAKQRWWNTAEYKQTENFSPQKEKEVSGGLTWIFQKFGKIKDTDYKSEKAGELVNELKTFISENCYTCSNEMLKNLGEMYVLDERFKNNIDSYGGKGTAEFVNNAIKYFVK